MTWGGDASDIVVSGNDRLVRFSGPKQVNIKAYINPNIKRGQCNIDIFYAEGITATTDAAIATEIMGKQNGNATIPVTWGNRLSSIAQTYSGNTRMLDFTNFVKLTTKQADMGTSASNASGTGWTPTVKDGTTTTSSITLTENANKNLNYNYASDVLHTNEAFLYTKNGTKTQKILLQQNELAVMNGGIGFSKPSTSIVGATGNYAITTTTADMITFPYGYVQGAKAEANGTLWNSGNSSTKI
jgi:hypothetical protein